MSEPETMTEAKVEDFTDELSDEALDREGQNRLSFGACVVATRSGRPGG
jgi:hypothetical protein